MDIICIDPSLTCTAVVVNDHKTVYAADHIAESKNGMTKWFDRVSQYIDIKLHTIPKKSNFADDEIKKLDCYDGITDNILTDILKQLPNGSTASVYIEGYSYSSASGPLIDLVTFGTLLRKKLSDQFTYVTIIPPSALKLEAAKLTYQPTKVGKKLQYRNGDGVSGGSFKKHDMYKCLTENNSLTCEWTKLLRYYSDDILKQKAIPKPIEDMNDAKLMYEIYKYK